MDLDGSGLFGHAAASSEPSKRTGGQRRLAANALPRPFCIWNSVLRHIVGCAVLSNAYQTSDDRCSARFGSFVALARPRQVAAADFSSYGMVHKLNGAS
jgi:hypothetical protein